MDIQSAESILAMLEEQQRRNQSIIDYIRRLIKAANPIDSNQQFISLTEFEIEEPNPVSPVIELKDQAKSFDPSKINRLANEI